MDAQAHLTGGDAERVHESGRERHHRDRRGIDAEQQVKHGHVADDDRLVGSVGRDACLGIELVQDPVHRRHDRDLQLVDALRSCHRVAYARDDVGAVRCLAVQGGAHSGRHARAQVHERPHKRRRAHVERDPEAVLGGVTWLDRDQLLAGQHGGHLEARIAQCLRQRAHHGHRSRHVMTLRAQRVAQARDVAALVVKVGLGELQVDLAYVGVDDDQAAQAHRRGLGHAQQLRHLARHVLVDPRLAGEAPAVVYLLLAKQAMVCGSHLARPVEHTDLALATRAAPAARRVDGQADPVRGAEQGGPWRHARGAVERPVGDLELALDHFGDAWASSAR